MNTESIETKSPSGLITTSNDLLIEAQWPQLKINEQRLVLYMLSLIQRSDKDFKVYSISIRELSNIIGSEGSGPRKDLYSRFDEATDGLMRKVIRWINPDEKKDGRIDKTTWCSSASIIPGKGCVELRFDPALKPFLLALKGNFTTIGEARAVIRLKNHYSLRLYQFIKYNQGLSTVDHRKSATVELSWLRDYLAIPADKYKLFGHLKSKVLVPSQKDISKKTDIKFTFKQIKKGRRVHKLEFFWEKNKSYDQMELPNFTGEGKATLEDILILEFGISPDKKAEELVQQYGNEHVQEALQTVREYITRLKQKNQKIDNIGGIARKAIEEGWKPTKGTLENQIEAEIVAIEEGRAEEQKRISQEYIIEQENLENIMAQYEQLSAKAKKNVQSDFRDYLVKNDLGVAIKRYDQEGLSPGMIRGLFESFLQDKFLQ